MCHDRLETDNLKITQDFMSQMLGVHRPGVTHAAMTLQEKELISYLRGSITIVSRLGLEAVVCECYTALRESEDRYLRM
jgi:Mn-dependent DtxR family transcriptional regulator